MDTRLPAITALPGDVSTASVDGISAPPESQIERLESVVLYGPVVRKPDSDSLVDRAGVVFKSFQINIQSQDPHPSLEKRATHIFPCNHSPHPMMMEGTRGAAEA